MCTSITFTTKNHYFGRNLDYEFSYGEEIAILPRNYPLSFRYLGEKKHHYALMGMAHIHNGYPLFYDGFNEKGLAIAGLNFVGNAKYNHPKGGGHDVAQYEFILYVLSSFQSVEEVKESLKTLNICDTPFNEHYPCAELHYLIADKKESIVVEFQKDGTHVYENSIGVLTNNPPYNIQLALLDQYIGITSKDPEKNFSHEIDFKRYSRGMGTNFLPGGLSSTSRFVKVAFTKFNSICEEDEISSVNQFFHILDSVDQQRGCCELSSNKYEITIYSSCCNLDEGIYYYKTYGNHQINAVKLSNIDLESEKLFSYALEEKEHINYQN